MLFTELLQQIEEAGGEVYHVGGYVRDMVFGIPSHDDDLLVRGLTFEELGQITGQNPAGLRFPVIHVPVDDIDEPIEIALPRTERSTGPGHQDFEMIVDPMLSLYEDAQRRDFTINALYLPVGGEVQDIIDPLNGLEDIKNRILRPTAHMNQDPIRIMRGIRFVNRFMLSPTSEFFREVDAILYKDGLSYVAAEALRDEFCKILMLDRAGPALANLQSLGILEAIIPEVSCLVNVHDRPEFHSEPNVFSHTVLVLREAADDNASLIVRLAALLHDIGKPNQGPGDHAERGSEMARQILEWLKFPTAFINQVTELIRYHMDLKSGQPSAKRLRKLVRKMQHASLYQLYALDRYDCRGRVPHSPGNPIFDESMRLYNESINVVQIQPLLNGREVMELLDIPSGPEIGRILAAVQDAQDEGRIKTHEDALHWLENSCFLS